MYPMDTVGQPPILHREKLGKGNPAHFTLRELHHSLVTTSTLQPLLACFWIAFHIRLTSDSITYTAHYFCDDERGHCVFTCVFKTFSWQ